MVTENNAETAASETEEESFDLPYTLKLKRPFEIGDSGTKRITEITFIKELEGWMVGDIPGSWDITAIPVKDYFTMISHMTGEPVAIIRKLRPPDLRRAQEVVLHFF